MKAHYYNPDLKRTNYKQQNKPKYINIEFPK